MKLSPFQQSALSVPRACNLALLGARGGGKTQGTIALIARDLMEYGEDASILIVRRTLRALSDFEDELLAVLRDLLDEEFGYNRSEKILRTASGGKVTLAAIEHEADYAKLQGKSFTCVVVEEVTQFRSERLLRLLRSNLRGPEHVHTRVIYLGNPGGPLHGLIFKRHVQNRQNHIPYVVDDEAWVTIASGPADNPFIDLDDYIKRLREACHGNNVLLNQWLYGRWEQGEGLMWPMFDQEIHVFDLDPITLDPDNFDPVVGCDWGLSAPSVAILGARLLRPLRLNDWVRPEGSIILLDEVTDLIGTPGVDEDLSKSREWVPPRLAEKIGARCSGWGVHMPDIVLDNARGLMGNDLKDMFRSTGLFSHIGLPRKGRRSERWVSLGSMLQSTHDNDPQRPHLLVNSRCGFLIHALQNSIRDEKDPDDVADTAHCPDHPLDSATYLIAELRDNQIQFGATIGMC